MNKQTKWLLAVSVIALSAIAIAFQLNRSVRSPKELDILVIAPLTGPGATLGDYIKNGIEIGLGEFMSRHPGFKMHVEYVDSKNQPKEGVSALNAYLARETPDAVICGMSSVSNAVAPICGEKNILMVATTTAMTGLPQENKTVVRVYPTSHAFVAPTADYASEKYRNLAIVFINDDFGKSNKEAFASLFRDSNHKIVAEESFELSANDHRVLIAKVLKPSPDAVFVTGYGPAYASLITQIREASKDTPILTEMSIANPSILESLGDAADGIVFAATELEDSSLDANLARAFSESYQSRFRKPPYMVAGFARDSIVLIGESSTSSPSSSGSSLSRSDVVKLSPFLGSVGEIRFDNDGEAEIELSLMQRRNGQTVRLERGK